MKILVCDDNSAVKMIISSVLESLGRQLEFACDGQDALEKIQAAPNSFDLLITDILMPRLTGIELVEKIRALNLPMKVIMITGFPTELNTEVRDRPKVDGFLIKPFKATDLLACLKKIGC
ncbi:MAG: response regulator [Verrucomicrobiota bacterium]